MHKRHGIKGVDQSGIVHCFLDGDDPLHFSTRLYDVKCPPLCFTRVLQLPQTARVYLHPTTEEEEANSLQNLSTVIINEVDDYCHLMVRKLSFGGDDWGPVFKIPFNANLKVFCITPCHLNVLEKSSYVFSLNCRWLQYS